MSTTPSRAQCATTQPMTRDAQGLRPGVEGLRDLVDRLLAEDGCPWDRAQTLESLQRYVIEEAYEVAESIHDANAHRGELGDLLFQVVLQSALREREGAFDLDDVQAAIRAKMVRRHPHVFARPADGSPPPTPEQVEAQWAEIKRAEAAAQPDTADDPAASLQVARGLPALLRAQRLQDKAAALGFDWPTISEVWDKLAEEVEEVKHAAQHESPARIADELGDVLFVCVRAAQKLGVDPERALAGANAKFERRFAHVLRRCAEDDVAPAQAGLARLDGYWNEARRADHSRE